MTAPVTVERAIDGPDHTVEVSLNPAGGRVLAILTPEQARDLRDALDAAAADAAPCRYPNCQNLALSAEFCGPHIEED